MSIHGSTLLHILVNHPFREHFLSEQYIGMYLSDQVTITEYIHDIHMNLEWNIFSVSSISVCICQTKSLLQNRHTTYIWTLLWHYWVCASNLWCIISELTHQTIERTKTAWSSVSVCICQTKSLLQNTHTHTQLHILDISSTSIAARSASFCAAAKA